MLIAGLFAVLMAGNAQEMIIPEGTILPVVLNETLNTKKVQDNDPILLYLADDIRAAGHRGPVLIPRGSNVVGRIVRSQRAGHCDRCQLQRRFARRAPGPHRLCSPLRAHDVQGLRERWHRRAFCSRLQ